MLGSFAFLLLPLLTLQDGDQVTVKVKKTTIKKGPNYSAETIRSAIEGNTFNLLGWDGAWAVVQLEAGRKGYIHKSAVVDRKEFVPSPAEGSESDTRPKSELALATKGFNPQVEQEYSKQKNLGPAYATLDQRVIPNPDYKRSPDRLQERVRRFVADGKLRP